MVDALVVAEQVAQMVPVAQEAKAVQVVQVAAMSSCN